MFSDYLQDLECKGECSKQGIKTYSWFDDCFENINTKQIYCDNKSLKNRTETCNVTECPPSATYGKWSDWSNCSCLENLSKINTQTRQRSCQNCYGNGIIETRNCPLLICEPECLELGKG